VAVYVDDALWLWQGLKWCHLLADDIDELHRFAARLGVYRTSYQGPPKTTAPPLRPDRIRAQTGVGARRQGVQPRGDRRSGPRRSGQEALGSGGMIAVNRTRLRTALAFSLVADYYRLQ
jgi:hypothetical protein